MANKPHGFTPTPKILVCGFTLVETMVAGTILLSLGLVAVLWLNGVSDLWWTSNTQADARAAAHQAVNRMAADIRSGTRAAAGSPPNLSIPAAPGNTAITFYLPADGLLDSNTTIIDDIGDIEWDFNPIQYVYVPAQARLQRVQGGTTTVIANDVLGVLFDDVTTDATLHLDEVKITLTLQKTTPQRRTVSATSTEVVKLRN
jgi:type II secretory pathway pseudopilin PulG